MNRSIVSMLIGTFVLRISTAVTGVMLVFLIDEITRHRGTGPGAVAVLTGGFYTTELTGAIVFGVLADRYGRKVIMLLGPLFGGIAVFMTGLTTHFPVLFVTRLLEGSSTAASIPSTLGFIAAETAHDEKLRGRVVSLFEFVSLGGMLAVGPALGSVLWERMGRPAFFLNCVFYATALCLYAYGVHEVPRDRQGDIVATRPPARRVGSEVSRYLRIATNHKVLLFAPTWLAINAILGMWALQAPLLLRGNIEDTSQFLMRGISPQTIGFGEAVLAVTFGAGLLFWGTVYARFRRSSMLLMGVGAFVAITVDILAINHLGGISATVLVALGAFALLALFVLSGATPAALGLLADVSEGFEEDRSAIMGLYSVFLGVGQVIGAAVGGLAASWRGIDGLVVATAGLLAIGIAALVNLRAQESTLLSEIAGNGPPPSMHDSIRDTLSPRL
ncbi:MAG: MFS transporter [Candidatus Limnocylindrales bacterium]|jgi:MFS family permease